MKHRYATSLHNLKQDIFYQLKLAASRYFPRHVTRPYPRSRLDAIRQSDSEQNALHTPPDDEYVDLCSVWAIEFYTPSHMNELLSSFERLGWTEDNTRGLVGRLKHRVSSQNSQAWMSLGLVIPHNIDDPYITPSLRADLPSNVRYAYGDIYCFTPSLIAIVFEFVFDEEFSRILNDALRKERESYVTPIPRGYRIHDPGNQRISHIKKIRKDTTRLVTDWFSQNIPGLCSAGLLEGDFPTCEFTTLRVAQPFPSTKERKGDFPWYLNDLGLNDSYESWESSNLPALRFSTPSSHQGTANYHSILAIHEASWKERDIKGRVIHDKDPKLHNMHRRVSGILGIWAIDVLLQGYTQHFRKLRNSEFLRSTNHESVVEALQSISESVSYSVDIAAVTDELVSLIPTKLLLSFESDRFVPRPDVPEYLRKDSLEQLIHKRIGENANWLRSMDNAVRDHLTQYGAILGTMEDISLQKKITWLTRVILFLTVVLVVMTAAENFSWIQNIWSSVYELLQLSRFF